MKTSERGDKDSIDPSALPVSGHNVEMSKWHRIERGEIMTGSAPQETLESGPQ